MLKRHLFDRLLVEFLFLEQHAVQVAGLHLGVMIAGELAVLRIAYDLFFETHFLFGEKFEGPYVGARVAQPRDRVLGGFMLAVLGR